MVKIFNEYKWLLILAILSFVLYDAITTIMVIKHVGIQYETSFVIRYTYTMYGINGFIITKIFLTTFLLLFVYIMGRTIYCIRNSIIGLYIGVTLAGLYAGSSNINIILNDSSFWLFGLDARIVSNLMLLSCLIPFAFLDYKQISSRGMN